MKDFLWGVWRWFKWPVFILVGAYCAVVIWRVFAIGEEEKTKATVADIHAQRITLADVEGSVLPPVPDQAENDSSLEGIDKNNNGIRDDVEHAIFKKYPADKKARAAALQYAMELQMEFTYVVNSKTLVAVIQEQGRGALCIGDIDNKDKVVDLVFNTKRRFDFSEEIYEKYMTSYALFNTENCDILY